MTTIIKPLIECTGEMDESGFRLELRGNIQLLITIRRGKVLLTFGSRNFWRSGLDKGRAHTLHCTEVTPAVVVDDGNQGLLLCKSSCSTKGVTKRATR